MLVKIVSNPKRSRERDAKRDTKMELPFIIPDSKPWKRAEEN
jgi:hypothetical protein